MTFRVQRNNGFASDALNGSFRQPPVGVLRNQVQISGNQLKLNS